MNNQHAIIFMFHCEQNTGYAIASLESVFHAAARAAGFAEEKIFWSYTKVYDQHAQVVQSSYDNPNESIDLANFIKTNQITTALAFDLGYPKPMNDLLRASGVSNIISYWGASMSSINSGLKLLLKKLQFQFTRNKPDLFIFESEAMRATATHGRGIPKKFTDIIYLGVDTQKFFPTTSTKGYCHQQLDIPSHRKIIFYSGHMEERKGVRVLVQAAIHLREHFKCSDIHFVICGNKGNEADPYLALLEGQAAKDQVTFAGYRNDIPELMRNSDVGVIASTGWDSFTMSSIEMMASGLPLIVSNLQGLCETIEPYTTAKSDTADKSDIENNNANGYLITPGNYQELAGYLFNLLNNPKLTQQFSKASRARAEKLFSRDQQIAGFRDLLINKSQ